MNKHPALVLRSIRFRPTLSISTGRCARCPSVLCAADACGGGAAVVPAIGDRPYCRALLLGTAVTGMRVARSPSGTAAGHLRCCQEPTGAALRVVAERCGMAPWTFSTGVPQHRESQSNNDLGVRIVCFFLPGIPRRSEDYPAAGVGSGSGVPVGSPPGLLPAR